MSTSSTPMFDFIVDAKKDQRSKRVTRLLIVSLVLHGIGLVAVLILDQLRVPIVDEPSVAITFVDFASLPPPPPPPPPPKKRTTPKKVEQKPVEVPKPTEVMAPKEIPKQEEKPPEPQVDEGGSDEGSEDGVEGGVEGGVAGGVLGGVVSDAKPPPKVEPERPPAPVAVDQASLRKKRIKGHDPEYPRAAESRGVEAVLIAKVVIGPDGRVREIIFEKTHALFESTVRRAIESWQFTPHMVNGKAVPMITIYKFNFRLQ